MIPDGLSEKVKMNFEQRMKEPTSSADIGLKITKLDTYLRQSF